MQLLSFQASVKSHAGKELPPNAAELHPTTVLNIMRPGLTAVELQRETGPNPRVTMGYVIDGQTYTGVGKKSIIEKVLIKINNNKIFKTGNNKMNCLGF